MFGGYGLYLDGLFFGLIDADEGQLYLRSDVTMQAERDAVASWLFAPMEGKGTMNYAAATPALLDDQARFEAWCERALRIGRLNKEAKGSALSKMRNLGAQSALLIMDVDVTGPDELRKRGTESVYRAVRALGYQPSSNFIWAVEGAIQDCHWRKIDEQRSATLQALVDELEAAS